MDDDSKRLVARLNRECAKLWRAPGRWDGADLDLLWALAVRQLLLYGLAPDERLLAGIGRLYEVLARRLSVDQRLQISGEVAAVIENKGWPTGALLPIVFYDPEPRLAAWTSAGLAELTLPDDGDPMTGPRRLLELAKTVGDEPVCRGLLSGILMLGDRRTLPLLRGCWKLLGPEERRKLLYITPGSLCASYVEFLLGWLEDTEDALDRASICGLLASLAEAGDQPVMDLRLEYPKGGPQVRLRTRLVKEWPIPAYGRLIEPRLRAMAEAEPEPRFLPEVLQAWRLTPVSAARFAELAAQGQVS